MIRRVVVCAITALVVGAVPALAQGGINKRQARQQSRIYQGIASGELTRREAGRIESQEARIAAREARARRSGGELSPREHRMLERALSRESRTIYRQKHDRQDR